MACNKSFSSDYMILDTENVELFDLFHLLFSSDLEKRKFIDCPPGTEQSFSRRWLIFASVAVQKMLQGVSKPLAGFGSGIEYWLNLLTSNSSFGRLLLNVLQGKVIYPDKTSASFISFNGNLDTRLSLDPNIKHGDCRYHAALSVMAAKVSYENKAFIENAVRDHWKMDFLGYYDFWNDYQAKNTTQAFMFRDKTDIDTELIVVSFRGTEPFDSDAWSTDIDLSWYELPCVGKIHGGFMKSLGLQRNQGWPKEIDQTDDQKIVAYYGLTKMLRQLLEKNDKAKFIVTGHSLGGALAILFPAVIMIQEDAWLLERLEGIYTFGQPRVGDEKFGEYMKEQLVKYNIPYYRFVYGNDLVPRLPYDDASMMFKHFGTCVYYDSYYKGQDQLKISVDAAFKDGYGAIAYICRDSAGQIVDGNVARKAAETSQVMEAIGIRDALLLAKKYSEVSITIESDAEAVVKAINSSKTQVDWSTNQVVEDIKMIVQDLPLVRINSVRRSANRVCDWLAKRFLQGFLAPDWSVRPCIELRSLLENDHIPVGIG